MASLRDMVSEYQDDLRRCCMAGVLARGPELAGGGVSP